MALVGELVHEYTEAFGEQLPEHKLHRLNGQVRKI